MNPIRKLTMQANELMESLVETRPADIYARIRADVEAENAARNAALEAICAAYREDMVLPTPLMCAIANARGLL